MKQAVEYRYKLKAVKKRPISFKKVFGTAEKAQGFLAGTPPAKEGDK